MELISKNIFAILFIFLLSSCDSVYQLTIIADLPENQEYSININKVDNGSYWIISDLNINSIKDKTYSGFSKILENYVIGPGLIKVDLEKEIQQLIKEIEFINVLDKKISFIERNKIKLYKRNSNDIILVISITE